MKKPFRVWFLAGALAASASVGLAAWHAHGLKSRLSAEAFEAFGRALHQQEFTAVGLMLLGLAGPSSRRRFGHLAGGVLLLGMILFCGSIYLSTAGGLEGALRAAPAGGIALILGWILLGWAGCRAAGEPG
ncbi:MAG: DUF423 domain-containing protein [Planctomycetota bacterium]